MADTAASKSPGLAKNKPRSKEAGSRKPPKKAPGVDKSTLAKGDDSQAQINGEEYGQTETTEEVGQKVEEPEESEGYEGSEAVPIGKVDVFGNVVDEGGNILGQVDGDVPEGSIVDTEGDVLDSEGNVIGRSELTEEGAEEIEGTAHEAAEGIEKPEVVGPFTVQDDGQVANAAGIPIAKLAEGEPEDLVGQSIEEIDEEGNLKDETGSIIGKAEFNPEVLEEGEHVVCYNALDHGESV